MIPISKMKTLRHRKFEHHAKFSQAVSGHDGLPNPLGQDPLLLFQNDAHVHVTDLLS